MQVPSLSKLLVFRIEHIDNLPHILEHGMPTRGHPAMNPNHVFIGNKELTNVRHNWLVRPRELNGAAAAQYGTLGEYVPFYFGPKSPMLYMIVNGFKGVPKRPQSNIVYICCKVATIINSGVRFAFTDGHANKRFSHFYSDIKNLDTLSWSSVYAPQWENTESDFDHERKKQAEMLVHEHVPATWINAVVVYDEKARTFAQDVIDRLGHKAVVRVNPTEAFDGCGFYYDEK
jgi:hypothetical protein